jgi:hypothetical protein
MQIPVFIALLILITLSLATLWFFFRKRRRPTNCVKGGALARFDQGIYTHHPRNIGTNLSTSPATSSHSPA